MLHNALYDIFATNQKFTTANPLGYTHKLSRRESVCDSHRRPKASPQPRNVSRCPRPTASADRYTNYSQQIEAVESGLLSVVDSKTVGSYYSS